MKANAENSKGRLFYCESFRNDCGRVFFSKMGNCGWKLDVQDNAGNWAVDYGDHVETTIDEIMPYVLRFVDDACQWIDEETGENVTFWHIVSSEFEAAYKDVE